MAHSSALTNDRLDLLYHGEGFGGDTTLRAKVVRELIDEIRTLRNELAAIVSPPTGTEPGSDGRG
jgi:hypothetical protein